MLIKSDYPSDKSGNAEYLLDRSNESLWCDGREIKLRPKLYALLDYMIEHPLRLLTLDELLNKVWPDAYVSPEIIKTYVHDLRKILHDDPDNPRFIVTVRRRGYTFIGRIAIKPAPVEGRPHTHDDPGFHF